MTSLFLALLFSQIILGSIISQTEGVISINDNQLTEPLGIVDNSETDLDRVNIMTNSFQNGDIEDWTNPHEPESYSITRSQETYRYFESTIINEGSRSFGLKARASDIDHPAVATTYLQYWDNIENPVNMTISVDWRIEHIAFPSLGDRLEIELPIGGKYLRYCMGTTNVPSNVSIYAYYIIEGDLQVWNTLERNVSSDYYDVFGSFPSKLNRFNIHMRSYGFGYSQGYIDDFNLLNNTEVIIGGATNHGNFEIGGTDANWYNIGSTSFSDVSQSTDTIEGSSSMNSTLLSHGPSSNTYIRKLSLYTIASNENKDTFSLWWKIADWQESSSSTYVYIEVEVENTTNAFSLFYVIAYGGVGELDFRDDPDDYQFDVDNMNTTNTWTFFNTSILEDVQSVTTTNNLMINNIHIMAFAAQVGARMTILFDDISLESSIIVDRDFEDQGDIGDSVIGWDYSLDGSDYYTITDFAANGNKAGNFSLDGEANEKVEYSPARVTADSNHEMILDINWYLQSYNDSSEDYLILFVDFEDYGLCYSFMNASSIDESAWEGDGVVMEMPETNTIGQWVNWQIDLGHDYLEAYGEMPLGALSYIYLMGNADIGSKVEVIIDDFYIYEDTAPEITEVIKDSLSPEAGESIEISASVIDATSVQAVLHYRVDSGSWMNITMTDSGTGTHVAEITSLPWNQVVEYYVSAKDAYNKTTEALDDGDYFNIIAIDTIDPEISLASPSNESTVSGTVDVNVSASDFGSGISHVELYIDGSLVSNDTTYPFIFEWNTTSADNGEYNINVTAFDYAGNSAQVLHVVEVDNVESTTSTTSSSDTTSTTTTTVTETISPDVSLVAIVVAIVAGVIVVIVVVYMFILKKK